MSFKALGLTPLISVFDMPKSLAFYRDVLGFEVVSASPEVVTRGVDSRTGCGLGWELLRLC